MLSKRSRPIGKIVARCSSPEDINDQTSKRRRVARLYRSSTIGLRCEPFSTIAGHFRAVSIRLDPVADCDDHPRTRRVVISDRVILWNETKREGGIGFVLVEHFFSRKIYYYRVTEIFVQDF